jgi:methyl-accepting chemotaxis protein
MTSEEFERGVQRLLKQHEQVTDSLVRVCDVMTRVQTGMEQLEGAVSRTIDLMEKVFDNGEQIVNVMRDLTDAVRQTNTAVSDNSDRLLKLLSTLESYFGSSGGSIEYEN